MTLPRRCLAWSLLLACVCPASVHDIHLVERSDVLEGRSFGSAVAYERIIAKVHFQVDPKLPANRIISDIDLAPRNKSGLVEFSADLYVLTPRDPAMGNGTVLFDVVNRGNIVMLSTFNLARGSNDPRTQAELGDSFLLERGYTLVWLGWQFDVPREPERLRLSVPVARNKDGTPIVGLVRADFVPKTTIHSHSLADRNHIAYPVLDPDNPSSHLTVRDHIEDARRVIPRNRWQFAPEENGAPAPDPTGVYLASRFEPGKIYEVVYKAKDPALAGLGPAAVRDLISFLKYNQPRRNTLLGAEARYIKRAIGFGVSQSGRFLRTFLYYGFNRDEQNRRVFDAIWAHVAGGGRGSFNHRFAQPSRDAHPHMNFFHPTDIYPFADMEQADPQTGLREGILSRAREDDVVPKIFYTNTSYEYWGRAGSLIHTTLDGKKDAPLAAATRIYLLAGCQHGAGGFPPGRSGTQNLSNPDDYRWAMRALLVALNRWATTGDEPPASRYPLIATGELAPLKQVRFPKIPGIRFPTRLHKAYRVDYGPEFRSKGIVSIEPPKVGKPFAVLVPQVDADGNETSGIRLPVVQVPLGTFTGWNLRTASIGAPDELYDMVGSYIPFARTKTDRERNGDPRPSVEERYDGRQDYMKKLRGAAEALATHGYVLAADIPKIVEAGVAQWDFVMNTPAHR